jgi:TorA maturation chaperone TorD
VSGCDPIPAGTPDLPFPLPPRGRGAGGGEGTGTAADEHAQLAEARSKTWWLLGRFYLERPGVDFLQELRAAFGAQATHEEILAVAARDGGHAGTAGATPGPVGMDQDVRLLRDALGSDLDVLSKRLLPEYTRLFRGIQEGLGPPPPFESLYRGETAMGDSALAVQRRYEQAGFGPVAPEAGPQDHLGAELRFQALLCFREAEAWGGRDLEAAQQRIGQQRAFLDEHLLAWLPDYAGRIVRESREPFYAAAVRLTLDHAEAVRAHIDALEDELQAA